MQNSSPDINVNSGKRKATTTIEKEHDKTDLPTSATTTTEKKKRMTTPPEGYICNLCQQSGHWIQQCPDWKQQTRKKKKYKDDQSNQHIPIPGVDPSEKDIRDAQKYQLWMATHDPPLCFCQNPSRLKKVKPNKKKNGSTGYGQTEESSSYTSSYQKRSSPSQQHQQQSRAVGHYFFFCATPRKDGPCRFARLAEQVMKEQRRKDHKKEQEKSKNDTQKEKEEAIGSNQNDDSAVDAAGP